MRKSFRQNRLLHDQHFRYRRALIPHPKVLFHLRTMSVNDNYSYCCYNQTWNKQRKDFRRESRYSNQPKMPDLPDSFSYKPLHHRDFRLHPRQSNPFWMSVHSLKKNHQHLHLRHLHRHLPMQVLPVLPHLRLRLQALPLLRRLPALQLLRRLQQVLLPFLHSRVLHNPHSHNLIRRHNMMRKRQPYLQKCKYSWA